jgi:hypothetical protein
MRRVQHCLERPGVGAARYHRNIPQRLIEHDHQRTPIGRQGVWGQIRRIVIFRKIVALDQRHQALGIGRRRRSRGDRLFELRGMIGIVIDADIVHDDAPGGRPRHAEIDRSQEPVFKRKIGQPAPRRLVAGPLSISFVPPTGDGDQIAALARCGG